MADLTAADPVAVVLGWLAGHERVTAEFGAGRVSGLYEAPWPRLRVSPGPGGQVDDVLWQSAAEVTCEVVDDPANLLGQAELWRLAMVVILACRELPERDVLPGEPVVTVCRPSGTAAWSPLATGQGRWVVGVSVQLHPPPG